MAIVITVAIFTAIYKKYAADSAGLLVSDSGGGRRNSATLLIV